MNDVLVDTNALLWALFDVPRLSAAALAAIRNAEASGTIYIATITLVEVIYLEDKYTFPYPNALATIYPLLSDKASRYKVLPLTFDAARAVEQVARAEVPDMPDRIISATAVEYRLPLVSADSDIRNSASLTRVVPVIW